MTFTTCTTNNLPEKILSALSCCKQDRFLQQLHFPVIMSYIIWYLRNLHTYIIDILHSSRLLRTEKTLLEAIM